MNRRNFILSLSSGVLVCAVPQIAAGSHQLITADESGWWLHVASESGRLLAKAPAHLKQVHRRSNGLRGVLEAYFDESVYWHAPSELIMLVKDGEVMWWKKEVYGAKSASQYWTWKVDIGMM